MALFILEVLTSFGSSKGIKRERNEIWFLAQPIFLKTDKVDVLVCMTENLCGNF